MKKRVWVSESERRVMRESAPLVSREGVLHGLRLERSEVQVACGAAVERMVR